MMRRAQKGLCVNCSVIVFLQQLGNMHAPGALPTGDKMKEALRLPHMQEQFAAVMRAGKADANPDEIDWNRVIDLWDIEPSAKGILF